MDTGYKVCDVMTQSPITVLPDVNLKECARIMAENHVGSLLVKKSEKVIGILTEQDMVRKAMLNDFVPSRTKVKDIMETKLITISPESDVFDAIRMMRDYNIRRLPVMIDGDFLGLATMKDILKLEPELFAILSEKIVLREQERKPVRIVQEKEGVCQSCGEYSEDLTLKEGTLVCSDCLS